MIYVTQGHERSISIEVFLKSCLHLSNKSLEKITFICNKASIASNLKDLNIKSRISEQTLSIYSKTINCHFVEDSKFQSTACLEYALSIIKTSDILLTLPTSKDQLVLNNVTQKGHTEYLRSRFDNKFISMNFISDSEKIILITDHIPLKEVSVSITKNLILKKVSHFISRFPNQSEYYISGINPHAGENGLLGTEEDLIKESIKELKTKFPKKSFLGPIPGDTIYQYSERGILVFMAHDQALSYFKSKNLFRAINLSLGLPFIRISPDHGTAFDLYGKNKANYFGCLYCLNWSLKYF